MIVSFLLFCFVLSLQYSQVTFSSFSKQLQGLKTSLIKLESLHNHLLPDAEDYSKTLNIARLTVLLQELATVKKWIRTERKGKNNGRQLRKELI